MQSQQATEVQHEIQHQQEQQEQQAKASLSEDAQTAIAETKNAIQALGKNDKKAALEALERADGKVEILLARHPTSALLPVDFEVHVIDTAPNDMEIIAALRDAVEEAVRRPDYPDARALLDALCSEIRERTYNLPLGSYPLALTRAAQLIEEGQTERAESVLFTAINSLVIVDTVSPIPLIELRAALRAADEAAQKEDENQRRAAGEHLDEAAAALLRGEALGYIDEQTARDFEKQIDELTRRLKGQQETASAFDKLRQAVASVFSAESEAQHTGQTEE